MEVEEIEMTEDEYEDELNEIYGTVDICGVIRDAGTLLRKIDIISFNSGLYNKPLRYKCGICGSVYYNEDKAEDCCSEHKEE